MENAPLAITLATWFTVGLTLYAGLGLLFALAFAFRGAGKVDPAAREGTLGFRLLIIPGSIALWPLLLGRWFGGAGPPTERNPHRNASRGGQ